MLCAHTHALTHTISFVCANEKELSGENVCYYYSELLKGQVVSVYTFIKLLRFTTIQKGWGRWVW